MIVPVIVAAVILVVLIGRQDWIESKEQEEGSRACRERILLVFAIKNTSTNIGLSDTSAESFYKQLLPLATGKKLFEELEYTISLPVDFEKALLCIYQRAEYKTQSPLIAHVRDLYQLHLFDSQMQEIIERGA